MSIVHVQHQVAIETSLQVISYYCKNAQRISAGTEPVRVTLNRVEIVDSVLSTHGKSTWFRVTLTASTELAIVVTRTCPPLPNNYQVKIYPSLDKLTREMIKWRSISVKDHNDHYL